MVNRASSGLISQGSGEPTLVFLHYFSGAAASWQWTIEALQSSYRCVALDLPGFGDVAPLAEPSLANYSAFVREAMERLELTNSVLIGHSMGAKIALQTAIDSDALQRVILVAPSPPTQEPMPEDERNRLLGDHHSTDVAATTVDGATQQPLPESRREIAIDTHIKAEDRTWRWWLKEGMNHRIDNRLGEIQVPVTVIASTDDPVIPWETIEQDVMALIAKAELIQLSDVGHLIPLEVPEKLAQSIRQAVDS